VALKLCEIFTYDVCLPASMWNIHAMHLDVMAMAVEVVVMFEKSVKFEQTLISRNVHDLWSHTVLFEKFLFRLIGYLARDDKNVGICICKI
jgi:hypothetical protein